MRFVLPLVLLAGMASAQTVSDTTVRLDEETVQGVSESTDRYFPPIQHRYEVRLKNPENPKWSGRRVLSESPSAPFGGLLNEPRGTLLSRFPGITATGWNPPDPTVACGPTHLVATVNSSVAFFTKSGIKTFEVGLDTFFSGVSSTTTIFDPKVLYDSIAKRFVMVVLDSDFTSISKLLVAVSDDSDPTGVWHKYSIESTATVGGVSCWGDYPGFGLNKDGYAIALNMFGFSTSFEGIQIIAIKKSSVLSGGAATVTKFVNTAANSFSLQASEGFNATSDKIFLVNAADTTHLKVWTLGGLAGVPPTPTSQLVTVPAYEFPPGSSFAWDCESFAGPSVPPRILDGLDSRLINAVYRGTSLLTTHSFEMDTDARSRTRWYEMNIPATGGIATLVQSGEVKEPTTADRHIFMGSVAKNAANDIALVMTKSGVAGPTADLIRTARKSTDAAGTMGAPVLVLGSPTPYGTSGFNRWGDYSAITVDPSDGSTFWLIHMTGSGGSWTTEIASFGVSSAIKDIAVPSMIYGGGTAFTATATVNVSSAASQTISLASSNTTLMTVPATTTLSALATTKTFTVTTPTGVNVNTSVSLTATLNGVAFVKSLTIRPAIMQSLTLNFSTIAANQVVVGTATLTGKAGSSGRTATLSSSTTAAAVPASLIFASGIRTATFNISTLNTSVPRSTVIGAVLGVTKGATLTVVPPPPLTTYAIASPKSVKGGLTINSTATITSAAPAGGVRIKFTESSAFVSLTTFKTVAAGTSSITNLISTTAVTTPQTVVITASLNGVTKPDTLMVTP